MADIMENVLALARAVKSRMEQFESRLSKVEKSQTNIKEGRPETDMRYWVMCPGCRSDLKQVYGRPYSCWCDRCGGGFSITVERE